MSFAIHAFVKAAVYYEKRLATHHGFSLFAEVLLCSQPDIYVTEIQTIPITNLNCQISKNIVLEM